MKNNSNSDSENQEAIKEKTNVETNTCPDQKYSLCGYLLKHSDKVNVRGFIRHGTVGKKRWFVYSDSTCKLYYYKSEKDPDPLGEIDIAISTLSYNVDSGNNGIFTISSGTKDHVLEAPSAQKRLYWLQHLQDARRKFNECLNMVDSRSSVACIEKPNSGLLQDSEPLPEPTPDPHHDLIAIMNKSMDSSLKTLEEEFSSSRLSRCNLNLPLKMFRTSSSASPKQESCSVNSKSITSTSEPGTPRSPVTSPIETNLDHLSRRLRSSFKIKKPKFGKQNIESETQELECKKCSQFQEDLTSYGEEVDQQKDKCDAYKEAVQLLQKDLEVMQKEKLTLEMLVNNVNTDKDVLAIFQEKDRRIVDLEHSQQKMKNTISSLTSSLRDSRLHSEHLQEKVSILTTLLESKDNAIVDLSQKLEVGNEWNEVRSSSSPSTSVFYSLSPLAPFSREGTASVGTQTSTLEYDDIKDQLEGYKCQNTFLNKEILDLNYILKHRNEREQRLISESSNWEAKFYQIQSKYLLLLNDLHSPQSNQHDSTVLSQLLQDVVDAQGAADLRTVKRQGRGYNEYGFCTSAPPNETDLLSKADYLQKQSKANAWLAEYQKNVVCSANMESQWESFLAGTNAKELPQHPELKYLIREGIPYQYKGKVWRLLIESHIGKYKSTLSPSYYQDLLALRNTTSTLDPSAKQIELDLLRTLPNNMHYESPYSDGIPKLRRVLLAYSRRNLCVGYCQGLNRLGAIALLFLNEEDAFWCLVYVIEFLMPQEFYTRNLMGSQVDQRVLKDLIGEKLPRLHAHLEQHGLDISLFTFNWFLCIFVDAIPPSTYLYIWDSFLYEGTKVLFRFALAIFKLCEEEILNKKDYMAIFDYLRSVPDQVADLQRLKQTAFRWTNPLSMKFIRSRRDHHRAIVQAELEEVEKDRKSYHQAKRSNEEANQKEQERNEDDEEVFPEESQAPEIEKTAGALEQKTEKSKNGKHLSTQSAVKAKLREMKASGKMLLKSESDRKKGDLLYHSVKMVPKVEIHQEEIDDEQFEVITLKQGTPSDTDDDTNVVTSQALP